MLRYDKETLKYKILIYFCFTAPALLKTIVTGILHHMNGPYRKEKITEEFVLLNLADLFE